MYKTEKVDVKYNFSEQRIQQCANVLRTKIEERDKMGVKNVVKKLLSHSHRMVQVSRRVVDNNCDAVFRNGLLVFVHGMISGWSVIFFLIKCDVSSLIYHLLM